ncbi:MAG: hypothetical protein ACRES4_01445 [Nevskiales bacterium]
MQAQLMSYFSAEKQESLLFIVWGAAAILISLWLFKTGSSYRGMAYPLVAVALIHLTVGGSVYLRTDTQVATLQRQMQDAPSQFRVEESQRMQVVMRNFKIYKTLEIVLLAAGLLMTFGFRNSDALYAAGIGLIIQAGITLVLDLFAERRGEQYLAAIQSLQ